MTDPAFARRAIGNSNEGAWDVLTALASWRLWAFFGLNDIRQRYRRSAFGPLWLALGLGMTVFGIGILYSEILKTAPGNFVPFLAVSLLVWNLISAIMTESTTLFQSAAGVMSSLRLPFTSFVLRSLTRNIIVFLHCIPPVVIAIIFYHFPVRPIAVMSIPGFLLLTANLYWIGLALSIVCLRYRDVGQIVIYGVQLAVFLTPVIWQPTNVRMGSPFLQLNPFYHMLELVREPIIQGTLPLNSYLVCGTMLLVGGSLTLVFFGRARRYLIHWI